MGYINSSTATIVSILTRKGREVLARNDGTFRITKFKVGDDEINYQLYNPTNVDNEDVDITAIPILEPSTDADSALRFPLVTMPEGTKRVAELIVQPGAIQFDLTNKSGQITMEATTLYNEDQFYLVSFSNINSSFVTSAQIAKSDLYTVNNTTSSASKAVNNDYIISADSNLQLSRSRWTVVFTFKNFTTASRATLGTGPYFLGTIFVAGQQSGVFTTIDVYGTLTPQATQVGTIENANEFAQNIRGISTEPITNLGNQSNINQQ